MSEKKIPGVWPHGAKPRWYVMKTLLSSGPDRDINRRSVYRNDDRIVTFNYRMAEWHPDDDEALRQLCDRLNKLEWDGADG